MNRNRLTLLLLLTLVGFQLGEVLDQAVAPERASRIAEVGSGLVAASTSPDGTLVGGLRVENGEWQVALFDVRGKALIKPRKVEAPTGWVNRTAWSKDSKTFAVADGGRVLLVEIQKKPRIRHLSAAWQVRELRFRGRHLLARCNDNLFIWDSQSWQRVWHIGLSHVLHADLTEEGRYLAAAVFQEGFYVFDLKSRRRLHHIDNGLTPAFLRFCKGDQWIASAYRLRNQRDRDHAVVHSLASGKPACKEMFHSNLLSCWVSQDGQRLLSRAEGSTVVWDIPKAQKLVELNLAGSHLDTLSEDGKLVATTFPGQKKVQVWDAEKGKEVAEISHPLAPTAIGFSQSRRLDVTAGSCALWKITY